jgi:hypothetical protein
MSFIFHGHKLKQNEMAWACSMHGIDEKDERDEEKGPI